MIDTGTIAMDFGVKQAVNVCAGIQSGERVVIITDNDTKSVGNALYTEAFRVSPGNTSLFIMEDYGDRPLDGSYPLVFPDELRSSLQEADVSFYAAGTRKDELVSFRTPMLEAIESNKHLRHAHMPSITEDLMNDGMAVDYHVVRELSRKLYERVRRAERIRVTSPAGSDFVVSLSERLSWKISDGFLVAGDWTNLPDGEVFTCAYDVNGIIVIDGVLGDYFDAKYGLLDEKPVTLEVKSGRIMNIKCVDNRLRMDLEEYSRQDKNASRIGEFAIGTNVGLTKLVGNLLQDEKFPGVHVAIGHGYPGITGATWSSKAHCDAVLRRVTIEVDGEQIMVDGRFML